MLSAFIDSTHKITITAPARLVTFGVRSCSHSWKGGEVRACLCPMGYAGHRTCTAPPCPSLLMRRGNEPAVFPTPLPPRPDIVMMMMLIFTTLQNIEMKYWILSHAESCGSDAFHNIELIYLIRVLFGRDIKSVQREWGCLYVAEEEDRWPTWLSTGQMYFHNTFRLDVRRETGRHRQQGWASEGAWGRKSRSEVGTIWCPPGHPPLAAVCQPAPKCHLPAILGGIAHCAHRFVPRVNDKVCFIAYVCLHTRLHSWIPVYVGIKNCL